MLLLILILLVLISTMWAELRIICAATKATVDIQEMARDLKQYDVVFFGEAHDDELQHQLQAALLPLLDDDLWQIALSFEMWERDVQEVVDLFLKGLVTQEEFLEKSRAWSNSPHYMPLILYAKDRALPVIAANVPREYASRVAKQGLEFIENLPPHERAYLASSISCPADRYKEKFLTVMHAMSGHMTNPESIERLYQAQCLKDETMAESIAVFMKKNENYRVIHFNGDFHSSEFLGTVGKLKEAIPNKNIAVISHLYLDDWDTADIDDEILSLGTYILLMARDKGESK